MSGGEEVSRELIPDPMSVARRADAISDTLNNLRNAVWGRGATPAGPAELAQQVAWAQEMWLEQRSKLLEGLEELRGSVVSDWYETTRTLEAWERRANELIAAAAAAGVAGDVQPIEITHTVETASEAIDLVKDRVTAGLGATLAAVAIFGGGLLVAHYFARGRQ